MSSARSLRLGSVSLLIVLAACASAGKRLEQGGEAEAAGDYYEAAIRYAEAVEKDPSLQEARDRLRDAAGLAFVRRMGAAQDLLDSGRPAEAAGEYLSLDRLLARSDEVGVKLETPEGFSSRRRGTFDRAISELMDDAEDAAAVGKWNDARAAYQRVRRDLEPSAAQHTSSLHAEARVLLDWAAEEEARGRFRRGYDLAGEALALTPRLPSYVTEDASSLQDRTLAMGTRSLAVFPVTATEPAREQMETELHSELSDVLELDYWRNPPLFVVVADAIAVRQAIRRLAPRRRDFRPGRILDELGADFGAMVEVTLLEVSMPDPRQRTREARTADGRAVTYVEEEGNLRVTVETRVIVTDSAGREVEDFTVRATGNGRLRRGVYRGDPRDLELGRTERRLFDPDFLLQQRQDVEAKAVEELAARVADRVFSRVLSRIP